MSFKAILVIDDKAFVILTFSYNFNQGANNTGKPSQRVVFKGLMVTIEMQKDADFYEWMLASNLDKEIKISIPSKRLGGRTRTLSFSNAHLVHLKVNYLANSKTPASITLNITAAGFEDSFSSGMYTASWRTTFPEQEVEATVIRTYEPTFWGYFFEEKNGNRIEQTNIKPNQKITLVIETENADGETIDLNLKNNKLDYIYDGYIAENDIIKNIIITGDETRVVLKTIKEER